jgi:hypothetical protein
VVHPNKLDTGSCFSQTEQTTIRTKDKDEAIAYRVNRFKEDVGLPDPPCEK